MAIICQGVLGTGIKADVTGHYIVRAMYIHVADISVRIGALTGEVLVLPV